VRHKYQRTVMSTTATAVASAIAKNPLAIHWVAAMASAALDESSDRL
jgi:hypothetical protein